MSAKRDHTEPLVLYSLTVAEPSFKKSPVISLAKRPYATFAHDWNESNKQDIFTSQAERKLLLSKLEALEKKKDVTAEEIAKLQTELSNIPASNFRRIAVDDELLSTIQLITTALNGLKGDRKRPMKEK